MGAVMSAHGIDDTMRSRILGLNRRGGGFLGTLLGGNASRGDEPEELLAEIEEEHAGWWPERGDGKSWDVLHWTLTGRASSPAGRPTELFGAVALEGHAIAEWCAVLDARAVAQLAFELERVDEATLRQRLAQVPPDLYWADMFGRPDEHDHVVADARDFTEFVRSCAAEQLGLLITLS